MQLFNQGWQQSLLQMSHKKLLLLHTNCPCFLVFTILSWYMQSNLAETATQNSHITLNIDYNACRDIHATRCQHTPNNGENFMGLGTCECLCGEGEGAFSVFDTLGSQTKMTCPRCRIGKYQAERQHNKACASCGEGKTSVEISTYCFECPVGHMGNINRGCTECKGRSFQSDPGQTSCNSDCGSGLQIQKNSDGLHTACQVCEKGTYYSVEQDIPLNYLFCHHCPRGKTTESVFSKTNAECIDCSAGKVEESNLCVDECSAGKYNKDNACVDCEAGKFSIAGQIQCSNCEAGKYSIAGQIQCSNCEGGKYSIAGQTQCSNCEGGKYSIAGQIQCDECPSTYEAIILTNAFINDNNPPNCLQFV